MKQSILILGGCRSGKSRHALELAAAIGDVKRFFMATCIPHDAEMKQRVARHKAERGGGWQTIEVPLALPEAIRENSRPGHLILVDCLTLWTSNLMVESDDLRDVGRAVQQLVLAIESARCPVLLVSNEVGAGIVPDNRLSRQFRDEMGRVNQQVAACVDRVIWTVAGIPVTIKGDGTPGGLQTGP